MPEYENIRRIVYETEGGLAVFVPVCERCGRFVKADKLIWANESKGLRDCPNAMCSKCTRTKMLFEGFF